MTQALDAVYQNLWVTSWESNFWQAFHAILKKHHDDSIQIYWFVVLFLGK